MLVYDKQEVVGGEQLFSTILGMSISGSPQQLHAIAHDVISWKMWNSMHPDSTVIAPHDQLKKRYRKSDPRIYFLTETIYFPSSPMPKDGTDPKTAIIAIPTESGNAVYSISELANLADENGVVHLKIDDTNAVITVRESPLCAMVRSEDGSIVPSHRSLWFVWHGNHPDDVLRTP
jgi:hypothetical protein